MGNNIFAATDFELERSDDPAKFRNVYQLEASTLGIPAGVFPQEFSMTEQRGTVCRTFKETTRRTVSGNLLCVVYISGNSVATIWND